MAKLILRRFACNEDTDEMGFESPYFLTFIGDLAQATTTLKLTRKAFWDHKVDKGETWPVDDTISSSFDLLPSHTMALAAMVEKDNGIDVVAAEVTQMKQVLHQVFETHRKAGFQISDPAFISTMRNTFRGELLKKLASASGDDDDLMEEDNWKAVRQIALTGQPGLLDVVVFKGGTGVYHVRYEHV